MQNANKKVIHIGDKKVGPGQPVFVIAEAGVNHNGKLHLALKLIDAAARAGADAVKFQTFRAEQVVVEKGSMAAYQKKNMGRVMSQRDMLRTLELEESWYPKLIARARQRGIIFISTPHGGFESVDLLAAHRVPAYKFGSGDLTNLPLLAYAARLKKPMIVATGMATLAEAREAVATIRAAGNDKIILLHATTNYPTPPQEANLRAMQTLAQLGVLVGYSDHTEGIVAAGAAVSLGACAIEKHFTLDRTLPGPDHVASLEPDELKALVQAIRTTSQMLGDGIKRPQHGEKEARKSGRKSIVTTKPIAKGERFGTKNLAIKRPGTGLQPREWQKIIGKKAARALPAERLLSTHDIA